MKPKIDKIGFEVEAEFSQELSRELGRYGSIKGDASTSLCSGTATIRKHHSADVPLYAVEFVSRPITWDRNGRLKVQRIFNLIEKYRQKKEFHWNQTQGFHVHVSFKPKTPVDCWSLEFHDFFVKRFSLKFPTEYALRAHSRWCSVNTDLEELAFGRHGYSDRYKAVNFKPAFRKHGTIEFRVYPANRPDKLRGYVIFTTRIIKYFLNHTGLYLTKKYDVEIEPEEEDSLIVERAVRVEDSPEVLLINN